MTLPGPDARMRAARECAGKETGLKNRRAIVFALAGTLSAAVLSAASPATPRSPSDSYLAFVAAAKKATALDTLLPFLSKEWAGNLKAQPTEKWPVWLGRLKDVKTDIKITKETINGAKCTLETTGKSPDGTAMRGKVFLVQEDGEWKLDEEVWST